MGLGAFPASDPLSVGMLDYGSYLFFGWPLCWFYLARFASHCQ